MDVVAAEIARQREWARRHGLALSARGNRLVRRSDAIFGGGPTAQTEAELDAGAGGEMGRLASLRSSSALAVNVFESWRADPGPIAAALGGSVDNHTLAFESVARIPRLRGTPPHLDVIIDGGQAPVAVESKFLEMYDHATNDVRDSYFARADIWTGLSNLRTLAEDIAARKVRFRYLAAAQLIKHALGLHHRFPDGFGLVLLWYRIPGRIADVIDDEITAFAAAAGDELDFTAIDHRALFESLTKLPEPVPGYHNYLRDRYFSGVDA